MIIQKFVTTGFIVAAAALASATETTLLSEVDLPFRQEFQAAHVEIDLDGVDIVVRCQEDISPTVEIRHFDLDRPNPIDITVVARYDSLAIIRNPDTVNPLNIVIELTLPPNLPVDAKGSELRIQRICDPPLEYQEEHEGTEQQPSDSTEIRWSHFELEGGSVDFRGPGKAWFQGVNTDVSLAGTEGDFKVVLTDGTLSADDHRGNFELESANAVSTIHNLNGDLNAVASGGRVSLSGSTGKVTWAGDRSSLDIGDHQGDLTVSGPSNAIMLLQSQFPRLDLSGDSSTIRVFESSGNVKSTLLAGSLEIEQWTGRMTLQAQENVDVEISSVEGDVVLILTDDCSCTVKGVTGHTRGSSAGCEIDFSDLKSIEFSALGSTVTLNEVGEVPNFLMTDGDLIFRAQGLHGEPQFQLKGSARAHFEIPTPCMVQLQGPGKKSASVDVQGCDLRRGNNPKVKRRKKKWETRRPVNLTVTLAVDAKIRVDGLLY